MQKYAKILECRLGARCSSSPPATLTPPQPVSQFTKATATFVDCAHAAFVKCLQGGRGDFGDAICATQTRSFNWSPALITEGQRD